MPSAIKNQWSVRALAVLAAVAAALLGSDLTSNSAGDLQGQIDASRSAAASMRSAIAADTARIRQTAGGLQAAQQQLSALQGELSAREAQLRTVQSTSWPRATTSSSSRTVFSRHPPRSPPTWLPATRAASPTWCPVILESHGFNDLLERVSFMQRVGHQDAPRGRRHADGSGRGLTPSHGDGGTRAA